MLYSLRTLVGATFVSTFSYSNYLSIHPELSSINRDDYVKEVADEIEKEFENKNFNKRPPASVIAQDERNKVSDNPEERFIRLR